MTEASEPDEGGSFRFDLTGIPAELYPNIVLNQPPTGMFPVCEDCGLCHARQHPLSLRWNPTCRAHAGILDQEGLRIGTTACANWRAKGLEICRYHGANSPYSKAKQTQVLAEREAQGKIRLALDKIDPQFREQHPVEGLLEEVARSAQMVAWFAREVAKLHVEDPEDVYMADLMGFDEEGKEIHAPNRSKLFGVDHNNNLNPHPLLVMLNKERMNHAKLCALALEAGINEKRVQIAQAQANTIAHVIGAVLDNLGLSVAQVRDARTMVANMLRQGLGAIEATSTVTEN